MDGRRFTWSSTSGITTFAFALIGILLFGEVFLVKSRVSCADAPKARRADAMPFLECIFNGQVVIRVSNNL